MPGGGGRTRPGLGGSAGHVAPDHRRRTGGANQRDAGPRWREPACSTGLKLISDREVASPHASFRTNERFNAKDGRGKYISSGKTRSPLSPVDWCARKAAANVGPMRQGIFGESPVRSVLKLTAEDKDEVMQGALTGGTIFGAVRLPPVAIPSVCSHGEITLSDSQKSCSWLSRFVRSRLVLVLSTAVI